VTVAPFRDGRLVALPGVRPARVDQSVVKGRFAVQANFDVAVDASQGAEEAVLRLEVAGGPEPASQAFLAVPGAAGQGVADDPPSGLRLPRGLQDQRAGQVATARGDHDVGGPGPGPASRTRE